MINFACSARARGFNLDNVIVFPTDKFSKDISEGLGLESYYSREVRAQCCRVTGSIMLLLDVSTHYY